MELCVHDENQGFSKCKLQLMSVLPRIIPGKYISLKKKSFSEQNKGLRGFVTQAKKWNTVSHKGVPLWSMVWGQFISEALQCPGLTEEQRKCSVEALGIPYLQTTGQWINGFVR